MDNEDESGRRLCEYWGTIFQARVEGPTHHQYEDIVRFVQKAPDDIRWTIEKTEFDELIAMRKIRLLVLTEFHMVPVSLPGVWVRNSSLMLTGLCWKEVPFQDISLRVELSLSPRLLTAMTMEGLFDLQDAHRPLTLCNCDAARGQFLMARAVRQGCPASGFFFATAFDPILRWLQEAVIPRNPDNLEFLQPANVLTLTTSLLHHSLLGA